MSKIKKTTFEGLKTPSYEEIIGDINKRIGKRPNIPKSLPTGDWSKQALRILNERYLYKNDKGKANETPEQMCWRVSWEIASAEARWGKGRSQVKEIAKQFYQIMISREFLPNSPTLMNAGTDNMLQYSGCYVLPVEDSLEGIFDAIKYQALIHQAGGGTGFSFNRLRPNGSIVKSSSGTASGPVSFMRIFDSATNEIKQGGKRRGANMGILRIDHPDILEFIKSKEAGEITNFNISVAVTNKFMRAYKNNKNYHLVDPKTGKKSGALNARKVFNIIAKSAWKTGDPGLFFIDRVNNSIANPVPTLGPIESTNPCGEQPLYPYDACNLGSIFLTYFVQGNGEKKVVDWEKLKLTTRLAVRFLDNVIEVNPYPLAEIRKMVFAIRRIGLGIGGWADLLIELGIPYASTEALKLAEKIMKTINSEAVAESEQLAKERGPFPLWPISIYKGRSPRRNSTVTTIAPTGSISIIAGASSGIEPLFAVAYQHIVKDKHLNRTLTFINPTLEKIAREKSVWSNDIKKKVTESGVIGGISEIPQEMRDIFGTAHEIHHDWHIKMQSVFQKHTENAVSKTVNMNGGVSVGDIKRAYLAAWKNGCRGITVFRDGCKDQQVLNLGIKTEDKKGFVDGETLQARPFKVVGVTYKLGTPVGVAFITINENSIGEPLEIFINVGKAGSDVAAMAEALGRTISATLRFRGDLSPKNRAKEVAHQLSGIGGRRTVGFGPNRVRSLPDAVAVALSNHYDFKINGNGAVNKDKIKSGVQPDTAGAVVRAFGSEPDGTEQAQVKSADDPATVSAGSDSTPAQLTLSVAGDICPSCGSSALVYEEGCNKCYACGHSEC